MSARLTALAALVAIAACTGRALAHELRPGYLEIREVAPETFDALWKVPARGDLRLSMDVVLPETCETIGETARYATGSAYVDRWTFRAPDGLAGATIAVDGLPSTLTDVLVRVERLDGAEQVARLTPSTPWFEVRETPGALSIAGTYLVLGVEHILLGIDHLLFVLALLILVRGWRRLVATITAFTVAHSLTLAAATLGFVEVPQAPVEAVIALSIVFVAGEIVHGIRGREGVTARRPWLVAFIFGLLHGLGFAGALSDVGMPAGSVPVALALFNVGVEAGQLLFVAAALGALAAARRVAGPVRPGRVAVATVAYAIGTVAACWAIERTFGIL